MMPQASFMYRQACIHRLGAWCFWGTGVLLARGKEEKGHKSGGVVGNQDREGVVGAHRKYQCEEILVISIDSEES